MLRYAEVSKSYRGLIRRTTALRSMTLQVSPGEIVGLVGANGAGKTTAILLALGYLDPTSGCVSVLGQPAGAAAARSGIGWAPDEPIFSRRTRGAAHLDAWLAGHGWDAPARRARVSELLDMFGLTAAAGRPVVAYSLGMQQKLSLALAFSHRPSLLILDEPFSALDHRAALLVRDLLDDFRRRGGAVLISSHHLPELEAICDRAVFLRRGTIEREEHLDGSTGAVRIQLRLDNPDAVRQVLMANCPLFLSEWTIDAGLLAGKLARRDDIPNIVAFLASRGARILGVADVRTHLEDIFLEMEGEG